MIAGAGIIGIACAHYLNEAGFEVVIFDRGKAGGACSRANCGYICPSHIPPLTEPGAIGIALKGLLLWNPKLAVGMHVDQVPNQL